MRIILVHNPGAGDIDHSREALAHLIRSAGHTVRAFSSKDDRWHQALQGGVDLVAAAGGDGTVAEVARAVAGSGTPVAVLPFGTANNIACALRQENTPVDDLVRQWETGARHPFDLGLAKGAWGTFMFLEGVGAGLMAETMAEIDHGSAGYVNDIEDAEARISAALDVFERTLRRIPASPYEIQADGRDLSGRYVLVEALNFGAAGPNLRLAPHAEPADGLLDVVLVDAATRREMMDRFHLYREDPARAPRLPVFKAREVRIRSGAVPLHLDDEVRGPGTAGHDIELSVVSGAVTFVVPVEKPVHA